ncbi:MAG: hypothetical protein OES26_14060 [Gammaproteobacteria bacterium]|nr:hypothetical protein [Gammaproteobacteria bacterium]
MKTSPGNSTAQNRDMANRTSEPPDDRSVMSGHWSINSTRGGIVYITDANHCGYPLIADDSTDLERLRATIETFLRDINIREVGHGS